MWHISKASPRDSTEPLGSDNELWQSRGSGSESWLPFLPAPLRADSHCCGTCLAPGKDSEQPSKERTSVNHCCAHPCKRSITRGRPGTCRILLRQLILHTPPAMPLIFPVARQSGQQINAELVQNRPPDDEIRREDRENVQKQPGAEHLESRSQHARHQGSSIYLAASTTGRQLLLDLVTPHRDRKRSGLCLVWNGLPKGNSPSKWCLDHL